MKTMLKSLALITSVVLLVECSQLFVAAQNDQNNGGDIEGVWQTIVTPRICATGSPVGPTFPGILMFDHDGTMTGTSTAVTTAYGSWRREPGARSYSFAALSLKYDASGNWTGSRRITQTVTEDESGNSFTSSGTFQDSDTSGNPTISGCATSLGTRFQ
jgi:hypothetical protein